MHSEDEQANIEIATHLRDAIEYIVQKLAYEIQSHRKFDESLKKASQPKERMRSE